MKSEAKLTENYQVNGQHASTEKHVHFNGEKGYIATTVGGDCILGASLALDAGEIALTEAYSTFEEEAHHIAPDYAPKTVNTDGWQATQNVWLALFPAITIIQCFLHAFIKIRACSKKRLKTLYPAIERRVWDIYHASTPADFRHLSGIEVDPGVAPLQIGHSYVQLIDCYAPHIAPDRISQWELVGEAEPAVADVFSVLASADGLMGMRVIPRLPGAAKIKVWVQPEQARSTKLSIDCLVEGEGIQIDKRIGTGKAALLHEEQPKPAQTQAGVDASGL